MDIQIPDPGVEDSESDSDSDISSSDGENQRRGGDMKILEGRTPALMVNGQYQ